MENQMKTTLIALALLSFMLAGCVIEPGRGYGDRGWNNGDHAEHAEGYWAH
jgi:hypothetical protein